MAENTNEKRANRIISVMHEYCQILEGRVFNNDDGDIIDLLADLMHFSEQKGFYFETSLKMARTHYSAETDINIVKDSNQARRETMLDKTVIKTLKICLDVLNQIPNKGLTGEFKNSYALCSHIEKVLAVAGKQTNSKLMIKEILNYGT